MIAIVAVAAVTLGAVGLGGWGVRFRTTSDLFVASRAISPWWNAAAVCGEYLSAASFLGIAGLTMQLGVPALWQGVGFTAGYVALLLFVAAPLRRFGSYTISDFAGGRFRDPRVRSLAVAMVLLIAALYVVPQLKGAGLALGELTNAPYWVGIVVVAVVVTLNVGLGGMRGITYVQSYQFWIKIVAISVPAVLILIHVGFPDRNVLVGGAFPHAPRSGLHLVLPRPVTERFPGASLYRQAGETHRVTSGQQVKLAAGPVAFAPGAVLPAPTGTVMKRGHEWAAPVSLNGNSSPVFIYSLLIATFLGAMGLPHILTRFYTNPDGSAARRTTIRVLGLLGVFYLFPPIYGALGRALAPGLYVTGQTDLVVLKLPQIAWPGTVGNVLGAMVAAGAFAAFMSTSSGLLVAMAGTISHDIGKRARGESRSTRTRFRLAVPISMLVPAAVALAVQNIDISILVGWAFALAASTFCPMFVLGIWWPRLTSRAVAWGMAAGGAVASTAIVIGVVVGAGTLRSVWDSLLTQPAILSVPIAFTTMVVISLRSEPEPAADAQMLNLHAPEGLGLELAGQATA